MEAVGLLEQKIRALVDFAKKLKDDNEQLTHENALLRDRLDTFEHSILSRDQHAEERSRELAETKASLDDLIHSIDLVVEGARLGGDETAFTHELNRSVDERALEQSKTQTPS